MWHARSIESLSHKVCSDNTQTDGGPFGLGLLITLGPFGLRNPTRCGGKRRCDEKIGTPCSGTDFFNFVRLGITLSDLVYIFSPKALSRIVYF